MHLLFEGYCGDIGGWRSRDGVDGVPRAIWSRDDVSVGEFDSGDEGVSKCLLSKMNGEVISVLGPREFDPQEVGSFTHEINVGKRRELFSKASSRDREGLK